MRLRVPVRHLLLLSMLLDEGFSTLTLTMSSYAEAAKSIAGLAELCTAFPTMLSGIEPSIHLLAGGSARSSSPLPLPGSS